MTSRPGGPPQEQPAGVCPGCGTRVPDGKNGRPRVYCGDTCRKAVFRKKQADLDAIRDARLLRRKILADWSEMRKDIAILSRTLQSLIQDLGQAEADGNQEEDRDAMLERGHSWDIIIRDAARRLKESTARLAEDTRQYQGHVDRYAERRTEQGSQPPTMDAASSSTAQPNTTSALLAAASHVAWLTRPGQAQPLPAPLAAALARLAATLAAEVDRRDGTCPAGELETAATAVLAAARLFSHEIPATLATALAQLAQALPGRTAT